MCCITACTSPERRALDHGRHRHRLDLRLLHRRLSDLPARARPFLAKWKPSWLIKFGASGHRIVFDVHRAVGLWFWGLLLAIAMSAVYLNLPDQIFRPVVGERHDTHACP